MAWLYLPLVTAEVGYYLANIRLPVLYVAPVVRDWIPVDPEYAIYIPKIGANTKVVPNVNINDEAAYLAALKLGVAEVAGLSHPGKKGTTYLFAHSTDSPVNFARYNAVFYLLDKLEIGDEVQISYLDQIYRYQVNKKQILAANDTHYLIPQKQTEILVLQTCYPPGTSWKRLVIEARPVYWQVGVGRYNYGCASISSWGNTEIYG